MFRTSMAGDLDGMDLQSGCLIYSLWPGYLDRDRTDLREWAKQKDMDFHIVHSSGHASSGQYCSDANRTLQSSMGRYLSEPAMRCSSCASRSLIAIMT